MAAESKRDDNAAARGGSGARLNRLAPALHLLSTPIGAADDITLRGLSALSSADALAAEDTRVLRKLMDIHGVALAGRPLLAYHEHNAGSATPKILSLIAEGGSVVYASDAGAPMISDPGWRLAAAAREAGLDVFALPGPSATIVALQLSGLPTDAFSFGGFPPTKTGQRRAFFERWRASPGTLVFFESPRRLAAALADAEAVLGDRPAAVARELTKRFEEIRRGSLGALAATYADEGPPKGEVVVVVGPSVGEAIDRADPELEASADALLRYWLERRSTADAARTVAEHLDRDRKWAYARAVALQEASRRSEGDE